MSRDSKICCANISTAMMQSFQINIKAKILHICIYAFFTLNKFYNCTSDLLSTRVTKSRMQSIKDCAKKQQQCNGVF